MTLDGRVSEVLEATVAYDSKLESASVDLGFTVLYFDDNDDVFTLIKEYLAANDN